MTVPTQTNKAVFTANGVTTEFPFTFGTLPTADLVVTLIDGDAGTVVNPSDYTVRGAGRDDGGSVVFNDPPASGLTVLIQRLVPYTQPTDYKNQGSFYPRTHERSFDRATMQVQQLAEEVSRSLRIRPDYTLPVSLYLPTPEASRLIGWNADGSALRNTDPSGPGDMLLRSDLADPTGGVNLVAGATRRMDASETYYIPDQFPTIQAAVNALSVVKHRQGSRINLVMRTGYQIVAPIDLRDGDYSHFAIRSESFEATGTPTVVGASFPPASDLFTYRNARAPVLSCVIDMQGRGQNGMTVGGLSTAYVDTLCGIINAGHRGVEAWMSFLNAELSVWDGAADVGIRISNGSVARIRRASAKGCKYGISASQSFAVAIEADFSNASQEGIVANDGATISVNGGKANNCGAAAVSVSQSANVSMPDAELLNAGGASAVLASGCRLDISGAAISCPTGSGINASAGASVNASGATITARTQTVDSFMGASVNVESATLHTSIAAASVRVQRGAMAYTRDTNFTGPTSPPYSKRPNIVSPEGVIWEPTYVARNGGNATIPSGSTSVSVTHGLTDAPTLSEIRVTPHGNLGAASKFYINGANATTFNIVVDTAVAADLQFGWEASKR